MSDLVYELRAGRPVAPEALRERVEQIARREPEPRRTWSFPRVRVRRAALVLVPACVVLAALGALGAAIVRSPSGGETAAAPSTRALGGAGAEQRESVKPSPGVRADALGPPVSANAQTLSRSAKVLPPAQRRYQNYTASMRIRLDDVDDLSGATQRSMRLARNLGGYVVSVRYGSEGARDGEAYLTLRVPVSRVQTAVVRLSELGTILGQNISIEDVQPQVTALERTIVRLRSDIEAIDARLATPGISESEKARLEFRRERLSSQLREARRNRAATINRASFATVSLNLTTHKRQEQAAPPGTFRETLNDAGGILAAEAAWTLLILAVAAPFVVLLLLVIWGVRGARRLVDRRLLESS